MDVNHNPYVRRRALNIDSRFRDTVFPLSSDFIFKMPTPIKNAVSVRLSSIEFPNTYFNISSFNANTQIKFFLDDPSGQRGPYIASLSDGNYTTITGDVTSLLVATQAAIQKAYIADVISGHVSYDPLIKLSLNPITGRVNIYSEPGGSFVPMNFTLEFTYFQISSNPTVIPDPNRLYDWGLGYNLGFEKKIYSGGSYYTGSSIIDVIGAAYVLFQLNDYEPMVHITPRQAEIPAFAKIIIIGEKNSIIYEDGFNLVTKHYVFPQPTNIYKLHARIVDAYGEVIDLNGKNISFTLEIDEVTNVHAYEQYRNDRLGTTTPRIGTYAT